MGKSKLTTAKIERVMNLPDKGWDNMRALGTVFSLGATMAAAVIIGYFIGSFLDRWLHTGPWLTFLMLLLGVGGGLKAAYDLMVSNKGGE